MEDKREEFLKQLHDLLNEYGYSIGFKVGEGSDTYGLYDESIVIEDLNNKEILRTDSYWLTPGSILENF